MCIIVILKKGLINSGIESKILGPGSFDYDIGRATKIPFNGSLIMHATCVDINGSGVLIVGCSGSGKSSLAINLLALGSTLVADDQCELVKKNNRFNSKPKEPKVRVNERITSDTVSLIDEKGENITTKKDSTSKVFEKIYLDLQEDEIEFTHSPFKAIYNKLIQGFHNQSSLSIDNFINDLDSNSSKIVSDILINDEKYQLHDWERKNIYVKKIGSELSQLVNETILNMRRFLIDKKIIELQEFQKEGNKNDILEEVMSYYRLKKVLSAKLNRVV